MIFKWASANDVKRMFEHIRDKFSEISSGAASTLLGQNLTANKVLVSDADGKVSTSETNANEIIYFYGSSDEVNVALEAGNLEVGTNIYCENDTEFEPNYNITEDRAVITNAEGEISPSDVTATELEYLSGVTAPVQEQFNILKGSALSHNGIYRGKNITAYYTDGSLYTRIQDGTFEDIYLGDYFVDSKNVTWIVAGFDLFLNNGDTGLTSHHIVIIPKTILGTSYMNPSNTTAGGYKGSYMYTTKLQEIVNTYVTPAFGSHALSHRVLITNAVNATANSNAGAALAGCSSGWEWTSVTVDLMSEINVYGSAVCSSSFYDIGNKNMRFPLFDFDNQAVFAYRNWYWLSAVASATYFCYVYYSGYSSYSDASDAAGGVRPYLLIG